MLIREDGGGDRDLRHAADLPVGTAWGEFAGAVDYRPIRGISGSQALVVRRFVAGRDPIVQIARVTILRFDGVPLGASRRRQRKWRRLNSLGPRRDTGG
jgi:hypothetical protein